MSKWQEENAERNGRSLARLTKALPRIFPCTVLSRALCRPFIPPTPRLARSSPLGALIHFVPIASRGRSLPEAERQAVGLGKSITIARMGYRAHSGYRQRLIGNAHTRRVLGSAAYAVNWSIALAGIATCGTQAQTRMQRGTVPA